MRIYGPEVARNAPEIRPDPGIFLFGRKREDETAEHIVHQVIRNVAGFCRDQEIGWPRDTFRNLKFDILEAVGSEVAPKIENLKLPLVHLFTLDEHQD
jgi:hypothetical protein